MKTKRRQLQKEYEVKTGQKAMTVLFRKPYIEAPTTEYVEYLEDEIIRLRGELVKLKEIKDDT